ncbi:MAG: hypothetical protein MJE68_05235, partial [Proteobacteria bacterium]|nr:hypothetical protein [Pseudomonadota bacterium]
MDTTNADTPDSPPTATVIDSENRMESDEKFDYPSCGPQNDCNSSTSDAGTNSGDAASVNQQDGVPSDQTHSQRAKGKIYCTRTCVLITIIILLFLALIMLAAIVAGQGVYVSHLHMKLDHVSGRMDKLETQCSGGCNTFSTNETRPNSEVEGVTVDELLAQISNLSMEIERVNNSMSTLQKGIQTVQATHENDINQIGMNVSTMLTQINTSLIGSLQHFADEAASNISELNRYVEGELSGARNHSLMLTQNVSILIEQVSLLDRRSHELEMNATALESNLIERLSSLIVNVSIYEDVLSDLSTTQVEHTATIEQIRRNISSVEDRFEHQLSNTREYLTASLSDLNDSLSQIDTSHRAYLGNLLSDLNDLSSELMATKEAFFANTSALREELAQLSEDLDYINNNLTDLSSAQKNILLDLADIKEIHSGNISAIGQSLV